MEQNSWEMEDVTTDGRYLLLKDLLYEKFLVFGPKDQYISLENPNLSIKSTLWDWDTHLQVWEMIHYAFRTVFFFFLIPIGVEQSHTLGCCPVIDPQVIYDLMSMKSSGQALWTWQGHISFWGQAHMGFSSCWPTDSSQLAFWGR